MGASVGCTPMTRYPIYIVSKGRSQNMLTPYALERLAIYNYYVVVERTEYELYREKLPDRQLLVLPEWYKQQYDTCDEYGLDKSVGPGAARNFCIDHSSETGFTKHWVLDDNLDDFHRLNRNIKAPIRSPATFIAAEHFVDRYSNVPVSGFNYYSFCKTGDPVPPFKLNTRIYSCLLIDNTFGYRWRGRYNEDTDLSLRVLKDGLCTIQFNAFLCGKVTTQRMKGGNSAEFYDEEGTLAKSKMIEDLHPDVAKVVWKFNRWHHKVDYRPFAGNKLIRLTDTIPTGVNNYGMKMMDNFKVK